MSYELKIEIYSHDKPRLSWSEVQDEEGDEAAKVFELGIELIRQWAAIRKAKLAGASEGTTTNPKERI